MRKIDESDLPISTALGVLGLNGVTAYFGLLDVGQPRAAKRSWFRQRPERLGLASVRSLRSKVAARSAYTEAETRSINAGVNSAIVQGFLVFDFQARYGEEVSQLAQWLREGRITYREHILEGLAAGLDVPDSSHPPCRLSSLGLVAVGGRMTPVCCPTGGSVQ